MSKSLETILRISIRSAGLPSISRPRQGWRFSAQANSCTRSWCTRTDMRFTPRATMVRRTLRRSCSVMLRTGFSPSTGSTSFSNERRSSALPSLRATPSASQASNMSLKGLFWLASAAACAIVASTAAWFSMRSAFLWSLGLTPERASSRASSRSRRICSMDTLGQVPHGYQAILPSHRKANLKRADTLWSLATRTSPMSPSPSLRVSPRHAGGMALSSSVVHFLPFPAFGYRVMRPPWGKQWGKQNKRCQCILWDDLGSSILCNYMI